MKKIVFALICSVSLLFGEIYKIDDFQTDIFSKKGNRLKKIDLSLVFEGENLSQNDYKLLDALNIIISSFYIEDLFTSQGKERFKKLLKQFLLKKYMLDVDAIYLLKFAIKPPLDCDKLQEILQKQELWQAPAKKEQKAREEKAFEMIE